MVYRSIVHQMFFNMGKHPPKPIFFFGVIFGVKLAGRFPFPTLVIKIIHALFGDKLAFKHKTGFSTHSICLRLDFHVWRYMRKIFSTGTGQ